MGGNSLIPCKDCICVPICKYKAIGLLLTECDILYTELRKNEIGNRGTFMEKVNVYLNSIKYEG